MKRSEVKLAVRCCMIFGALLLAGSGIRAHAQAPGTHPQYLHALRDLREARGMLQDHFKTPAHVQAAAQAIPQIDNAIQHIKAATRNKEENLGAVPPPKSNFDESGLFHRVDELLKDAHHNIATPESDPAAASARDLAMKDIDAAIAVVAPIL